MKTPTLTGSAMIKLSTKELSEKTWPDFVKLFSQGNGWDHCCCVHFHRPRPLPSDQWLPPRKLRAARNRREQKKLIDKGCSHGLIVYSNGEPLGWCQYGPREELPRFDSNRTYRVPASEIKTEKFWRITCFVVDRKYRRGHRRRGAGGGSQIHKTTGRWHGRGFPSRKLGRQVVREYVHSRNCVHVQESGIQACGAVWEYQRSDAKNDLSTTLLFLQDSCPPFPIFCPLVQLQ